MHMHLTIYMRKYTNAYGAHTIRLQKKQVSQCVSIIFRHTHNTFIANIMLKLNAIC